MAILGTPPYNKSVKLKKIPAFSFVFACVFNVKNKGVYVCNRNENERQKNNKQNKHML
jgi:hypothetical protein